MFKLWFFGADSQNKNLRQASNIRVGSTVKARTANKYSAAISNSKTKSFSSSPGERRTVLSESRSSLNDGKPDPVRGSYEGLDNSRSTHIQMSGIGYDKSSIQTARYSNKQKFINPVKSSSFLFTNLAEKSIIRNYSNATMRDSSSDRMNKSLNINRLF